MERAFLDAQLRAQLNGLTELLEVCDEVGQVVGQFLPKRIYEKLVYELVNAQVADGELSAIAKEPGVFP